MINDLIEKGFKRRPKQKWPGHDGKEVDRTKFASSSELGYCMRKAWYGKHYSDAADSFEKSYGAAERGHTAEAWVVEQLRRSGAQLMFVGDQQVSFHSDTRSGTPDGMLRLTDEDVTLEFKSIDPRSNWNALPRKPHLSQVQQNMWLMREVGGYTISRAVIAYIDAANYQRRREFTIQYDPVEVERLKQRADKIMGATEAAELPPEGVYNGDCKYCAFTERCSGAVEAKKKNEAQAKKDNEIAKRLFR